MSAYARRGFLLGSGAFALTFGRAHGQAHGQVPGPDELTPATTRLNGWLENRFEAWLAASPMQQTSLGLKTNADRWDDLSAGHAADDRHRAEKDLADLRGNFMPDTLSPEGRLSYRLYEYESQKRIADDAWRLHAYPVNQMDGWQSRAASFLLNMQRAATIEDAEAYVARLNGMGVLFAQVMDNMRAAETAGILAPRFVYGHVIRDCRNLLTGAPFGPGKDSPLYADFTAKLDGVKADRVLKLAIRADAAQALTDAVGPAYRKLIALAEQQQARAGSDAGAWKLPDGESYYAHGLRSATTTAMTADELHAFGLAEVERIHDEMRALLRAMDYAGDLKAFFAFLRSDPRFRYPQTADGKAAYLTRAREIIDAMAARLPEAFSKAPAGTLDVRAVPPFREQSATAAFYQGPAGDDRQGGRPGTYFVNTYSMAALPIYEMEALAYHEAVPGHHLQVSVTRALSDLPRFRRSSSSYGAYAEGWGLYAEKLAKEMGFYTDPTADFGRLTSELWRAARMVADTGIHSAATRWSREKAIAWLQDVSPNADADIVNSVERTIVNPGQAAAYTVGMRKIVDLREDAKARLGDKFDLPAFHGVVLDHGPLTLPMLAETVEAWVKDLGG